MILDHYSDPNRNQISYLIACPKTRQAALINPTGEYLSAYEQTLATRNLRLTHVLLTRRDRENFATVIESLGNGRDGLVVYPAAENSTHFCAADPRNTYTATAESENRSLELGTLKIQVLQAVADSGSGDALSYQIEGYTFTTQSLLIGYPDHADTSDENPPVLGQRLPACGNSLSAVRNFRTTRDNLSIEKMLMEDLHASIIENVFSPKETLVVRAYVDFLEENDLAHPSAAQLGEEIGNIDRSVIHVLVHSIRWKQIDRDRLPLVLSGQASKWLRSLKTEPEFTPHEEEFLGAYLQLVASNGTPPSGPDIVNKLTSQRSIQWVRKRAFTVRRKQREFGQPLLILARNKSETEQRRMQPLTLTPQKAPTHRFVSEQAPIA